MQVSATCGSQLNFSRCLTTQWPYMYSILRSTTYFMLVGPQLWSWRSIGAKIINYIPFWNERDNLFQYFSLMKSSENEFNFFACILADYLAHESPKEFWKNSHFENMTAGFLRVVKIHFGRIALKWYISINEKKCIWLTLCCSFWSN